MPYCTRLSRETALVAYADAGTMTGAARGLGVPFQTLRHHVRAAGVPRRGHGRPSHAERVCPIHPEPQRRIPADELLALVRDLGISGAAHVLRLHPGSVYNRVERLRTRP